MRFRVVAMPGPAEATPQPGGAVEFATEPGPPGTRFGEIRRFTEIDSTNRYLLDLARQGEPEGLVAVSEHQSAGRGRLGRRWEAPAGTNLLVSVLLRPDLLPKHVHLCAAAVSLAAAGACDEVCGIGPLLKWPNDLVVEDRKLGGVLAESALAPNRGVGPAGADRTTAGSASGVVVVGLGLNVLWPPPDGAESAEGLVPVPDELRGTATSLWREGATRPDPLAILRALLAKLHHLLVDLSSVAGRRDVIGTYRQKCSTLGREVRVDVGTEVLTGSAIDIAPSGALVLESAGHRREIAVGDVVHLRQ